MENGSAGADKAEPNLFVKVIEAVWNQLPGAVDALREGATNPMAVQKQIDEVIAAAQRRLIEFEDVAGGSMDLQDWRQWLKSVALDVVGVGSAVEGLTGEEFSGDKLTDDQRAERIAPLAAELTVQTLIALVTHRLVVRAKTGSAVERTGPATAEMEHGRVGGRPAIRSPMTKALPPEVPVVIPGWDLPTGSAALARSEPQASSLVAKSPVPGGLVPVESRSLAVNGPTGRSSPAGFAGPAEGAVMSINPAVTVRRYYDLVDAGDVPGLVALFAENAVYDRPGYDPLRGHGDLEHFYTYVRIIQSGRHTITSLLVDGNQVAVTGQFNGVLKDGSEVKDQEFADFFKLDDRGLIVHRKTFFFTKAL